MHALFTGRSRICLPLDDEVYGMRGQRVGFSSHDWRSAGT